MAAMRHVTANYITFSPFPQYRYNIDNYMMAMIVKIQ